MRKHLGKNREKVIGTDKGKPNINMREYLTMVCSSGRLLEGWRQLEHPKEKTPVITASSCGLLPDIECPEYIRYYRLIHHKCALMEPRVKGKMNAEEKGWLKSVWKGGDGYCYFSLG